MNLQEWKESGIQLIKALRLRGEEESFRKLLSDLYPDKAHFIYELFQNAEDAKAELCRFTLTDSDLEFEHNGIRIFSEEDVKSITSFGNSKKRDDPTNIGKFGVGFKAVFAYTNIPEIHSGDFHFRIHDLVVPETDGVPRPKMGERETRFAFPFDNPKKPGKQAAEEVERGLRSLGDNTLLFLSHICKIEYLLPDGSLGSLERIRHKDGHIEIHASQPGREKAISHWLCFEKDVQVTDEDGKPKTCRIAIAYRLVEEDDKKGKSAWKIMPLDPGQVSIYFPAEKETSKLRFHIHAPFASTVARDSVRDCEANKILRDHLARLIAESLASIRDQGLLTVGFLAVLPNPGDSLSPFYEPIRQTLVEAFKQNSLVPVRAGGHATADGLIRCPAKLAKELSDDDLSLIVGKPLRVAANPTQLSQRENQFLKSLGISDWGWKELNKSLSSALQRAAIEEWMSDKDDESLGRWYGLLNWYGLLKESRSQSADLMNVGNVRIVRAHSASGSAMCLPSQAFFPPCATTNLPDDVNFVEPAFCSGDSRAFLESIDVRPYDEKATIGLILERYKSPGESGPDHIGHIRMFISFWKKNPSEAGMFKGCFLLGKMPGDSLGLCQPSKLYLDSPYQETLLSTYYERLPEDKRTPYPLASTYGDEGINFEDFACFTKAVGVRSTLDVSKLGSVSKNPDYASLKSDCKKRESNNGYKRVECDFDIPEFQTLLQHPATSASELIWKTMSESVKADQLRARYQYNNISEENLAASQLVHRLRVADWIPQANGRFVKPPEARSSELPTGFSFDSGQEWLKAIGFGDEEKKSSEKWQLQDRMARDMGLSSGDELAAYLDAIKDSGLTPEQIRAAGAQRKPVLQPEESVKDPEKRRRGVREDGNSAPPKESVIRERSSQPDVSDVTAEAKAYLRTKYKNSDGQLVCQCCHEEMPFKLRSGDYYFEAVQCVRDQDAHYHQNRLALCPTCAAMYQHARETDDAEIQRRIVSHDVPDTTPAVEILVNLAGRECHLHFVGTHWFDLKTVLSSPEEI